MTKLAILIGLQLLVAPTSAQTDTLSKIRFVIGVSAPELLHAGVNVDLSKSSQAGIALGVGPTWGGIWPALSVEHRLYFGQTNALTNRQRWFFRQGGTWYTEAEEAAATLTVGADLKSKRRNRGWTIDAGASLLFRERMDYSNRLYPALRFQYYSYFKKRVKKS